MDEFVVGLGEVLWDMLPEGKKLGGAPANFAWHVSQFGWKSVVASAVGQDRLGDEILDSFRAKGLAGQVSIVPYPTGTVQVELDAGGVPRYDIAEGVAWDNIPYTPALAELAGRTKAVCFGSLAQRSAQSRATLLRFLDDMPGGDGCYKVFDINLRQHFYTREVVHTSLQKCNVLKVNDEELAVVGRMFGLPDGGVQGQCRALLSAYGLKALVLTCGVSGSYVFTADRMSFMETPGVEVADTVGAGDAFTAAFVSGMLRGLPLEEAHRLAVDVSAFVCTQNGAMPVLPFRLLQ